MNLDFSKLTKPVQKNAGTLGTAGTSSTGAGSGVPTSIINAGTSGDNFQLSGNLSPVSPHGQIKRGRSEPAPNLGVPAVPNVPAKKTDAGNEEWKNALVDEFMQIDGLSLSEAQAMAAISIPARPPSEWLALISELDALIARYCAAARLSGDALERILSERRRQSLASIPAALTWFRRELAAIGRAS